MTIQFKDVSYEYSPNTPFAYGALKHVSVSIKQGRVTAIIGATGSGKTTLVQHLNALLLPTEGEVHILDRVIVASEKPKQLKSLRQHVGLVFQFPEYQLFEETVIKDVCFGPLNFNISKEEALERAYHALEVVGLDIEDAEKSPLDLSGGQKRRAAIAGILAIDPDVLVLDEPTAGLDPQGSQAMMELFLRLNKQDNKTILIVTHDMEHVFAHCDDVVVVDHGKVIYESTVSEFFFNDELIEKLNIDLPKVIQLHRLLKKKGIAIDSSITDLDEIASHIAKYRGAHHE